MAPNTNQPPAAAAEPASVDLTAETVEQIAVAVAAKLAGTLKPAAAARGRGAMASTFADRQAARLGKKPARGESK